MSQRKKANPNQTLCVACGACTAVCPREAITIWRGSYACVDQARCVGCGSCVRICPADAMELKGEADEANTLV